ncbi:MerR family transcriptional regulator [Kribbella sp. NPDC050124]|uniref:MerR family transcriptional regulator n=1 Tax=Kribbella sp. NPDC050124 TaxID=3364114 RepID=UPI0037B8BF76
MREMVGRTGVSERLLRYYEDQGLLRPERLASGYREYGEGDVALVGRIRTLLAAGLSTAMIAEVLPCVTEKLEPTCPVLLDKLQHERDRMSASIKALEESRDLLDGVLSTPVVNSVTDSA